MLADFKNSSTVGLSSNITEAPQHGNIATWHVIQQSFAWQWKQSGMGWMGLMGMGWGWGRGQWGRGANVDETVAMW